MHLVTKKDDVISRVKLKELTKGDVIKMHHFRNSVKIGEIPFTITSIEKDDKKILNLQMEDALGNRKSYSFLSFGREVDLWTDTRTSPRLCRSCAKSLGITDITIGGVN